MRQPSSPAHPRAPYKTDAVRLHRPLAVRANEAALLLALEAYAVEELLPDWRVVAVAHDGDHVATVIAQVLDGSATRHVPLVRHEAKEDENQDPKDSRNDETRQRPRLLQGDGGQRSGHAQSSQRVVLNLGG